MGWVVNATPRPLYHRERSGNHCTSEEAGWAPGPVWTGEENLAPTGIRSTVRPRVCPISPPICRLCSDYNRVLRKIFRPKRDGERGQGVAETTWGTLWFEFLSKFNPGFQIKKEMGGPCGRFRRGQSWRQGLGEEGKRSFWRPRRRWMHNIATDLKEFFFGQDVDFIDLA